MSLQVWLPLNGDLNNQGLSDIIFTGTPAWRTPGKIGASALNLSSRFTFNCPKLNGVKYFSICFWGMTESNPDSTANWMDLFALSDKTADGTTAGTFRFETGYGNTAYGGIHWHDNATNAIINGSCTYNTASEWGQWHHICVTISDTEVRSYYDGVLKQTHTFGLGGGFITGAGWIGETTTRGGIQDIRIYDHALSAKEVKEIAKGLVLHLPLAAPGGENLIINSRNITTSNYALTRATADGEKITLTPTTSASYLKYKATNVPYGDYKNKTYTVSFYARRISGNSEYTEKGVICYFGVNPTNRINNTLSASYDKYRNLLTINTITNEWKFYSFTATIPDDLTSGVDAALVDTSMITFQLAVSGSGLPVEVIPIKFEIGDHPTPWTPNPADPEYAAMGFNDGIEYDVSGYRNNGERVLVDGSTGSFLYEPSPRYLLGMNIHSLNTTTNTREGTAYIRCDCEITNPNQLTVAFWCYARPVGYNSATGQGAFCASLSNIGSDGIGIDYQTSAMNHRDTQIDVNSADGNSHLHNSITFIPNEWHHYTFVYDGQNARSYRDGVLQDTKSFSASTALGSFNMVVIGFSRAGGVWRSNDNTYSDFRVYTTALSAEDILALYNTPESLTNTGTLLTQGEFVEV